MGKRRSSLGWLLFVGLALGQGCSRQDTECLSSIGRKIVDRAGAATTGYRDKLDGLKSLRSAADSIQHRVSMRLRWEKMLTDSTIEVIASGKEIELKGTVKSAEQRTRAVELAESTAGVERAVSSLIVLED
jgi:osmotically-inducible protein OsmY